jgi:hypothetical protein
MKERNGEEGLTTGSGYFNLPTVGLNGLRSPFSAFFFFFLKELFLFVAKVAIVQSIGKMWL